jgi:UDP-glucose 4-epimerase
MIAAALHKPPRLFRFPPFLLHAAGKLCGQGPVVERLIGSLTVDTRKIKNDLGWTVPTSLREGLGKTALWYKGIAHSHSSTHG